MKRLHVTAKQQSPFALSLSKGGSARSWFDAPKEIPLGDKLTTNGGFGVGRFNDSQ